MIEDGINHIWNWNLNLNIVKNNFTSEFSLELENVIVGVGMIDLNPDILES